MDEGVSGVVIETSLTDYSIKDDAVRCVVIFRIPCGSVSSDLTEQRIRRFIAELGKAANG